MLIKNIFFELNTYKSDIVCFLYLLSTKKSVPKHYICPFLALNVSKNGPNDQIWRAITRSFLVQFQKIKYRCNQDIEIYKNLYSKYNFGLLVKKKNILGPRNWPQSLANPIWPKIPKKWLKKLGNFLSQHWFKKKIPGSPLPLIW